MSTAMRLNRRLADAMSAATPPTPVLVGLSSLRHLGSVGVSLLTTYHLWGQAVGRPLRIVAGNSPVREMLSMGPVSLNCYLRERDSGDCPPEDPPVAAR